MKYSYRFAVVFVVVITMLLLFSGCSSTSGQKEVELKYDSGKARDFIATCGGYAIVEFSVQKPFVISKIRVSGVATPGGRATFQVGVCDADKKVIWEDLVPATVFDNVPAIIGLTTPDIKVNGKFYVFIWTGTCTGQGGVQLGVDDSGSNKHSSMATRKSTLLTEIPWNTLFPASAWYADKNKVNWMISVLGNYE